MNMLEPFKGKFRSGRAWSKLDKFFYNLAKAKGFLGAT